MAKKQKKALERVVSIEAYRQARTQGVDRLASQILTGRLCPDFHLKDWRTVLAQLKNEMSQIDRAILALTRLTIVRAQPVLNQATALQRKQGRR